MLSENYLLQANNVIEFDYMRKLNQKKIRWIIREMEKEERFSGKQDLELYKHLVTILKSEELLAMKP